MRRRNKELNEGWVQIGTTLFTQFETTVFNKIRLHHYIKLY